MGRFADVSPNLRRCVWWPRMSRYSVPMMKRPSMPLWDAPTKMAQTANEEELCTHLVVSVKATDEKDAARRAEMEHPEFIAIRSAVTKQG